MTRIVTTTALSRIKDVQPDDVILDAGVWRYVADKRDASIYDAMSEDDRNRELQELILTSGRSSNLTTINAEWESIGDRDVFLHLAVDEDRTDGGDVYQLKWVRYPNPYQLVEVQLTKERT